jgi:hypothetical protein
MPEQQASQPPVDDVAPAPRTSPILGWGLLAALVGYTYLIHQGIGPEPGRNETWYTPTSFLFSAPVVSELFETLGEALAWFGLPALFLAIATFITNRSAVARSMAISCVLATVCFIYYGTEADQIWTFFHWRASAVLTLMTMAIGFSIGAPFLAHSWLRLGWPARIATYLPFLLLILAFMRNATGTDQSLQFALSPWPAISMFGIGLGSMFTLVLMLGTAIGIAGIARARRSSGSAAFGAGVTGVALGLAVPACLLWLGDSLSVFAFSVGATTLSAMTIACAVAIGLGTLRAGGADGLHRRAVGLAVGAAMVAVPVVSGQALARYDYYVTREILAREVTDALAAYLEKEEIYPDELDELVTDGYLTEIPEPAIGFSFLYDGEFRYRSFGTSFILEFPAPGWVECAYTPPYLDEDEYEGDDDEFGVGAYDNPAGNDQYADTEEDEIDVAAANVSADNLTADKGDPHNAANMDDDDDEFEDDSLDEAWSCPTAPPKLW